MLYTVTDAEQHFYSIFTFGILLLIDIVRENINTFPGGCVFNFSDLKWLDNILELGLYFGVNGAMLMKPGGLDVIKKIPLDRMILGTSKYFWDIF